MSNQSLTDRLKDLSLGLTTGRYGKNQVIEKLDSIAEELRAFARSEIASVTEGYPGIAHDFEMIRSALAELIELKDISYRVENRAQFDINKDRAREMEREYKNRRPLAWEAARAALKNAAPPVGEGSKAGPAAQNGEPAGAAPELKVST